jgi:preprotein translocase subunit SecA
MNFEARKNLLEYDEVMDAQRKRIYGKRQDILNDANPKAEIMAMIEEQVASATKRFLNDNYGTESFREYVSTRLGMEFEANEFRNMVYEEASSFAHERATNNIQIVIQEGMDENLSVDDDPSDWKWQEMTRMINAKYGLKLKDSELRAVGRENLSQFLLGAATQAVNAVDLKDGKKYLDRTWGVGSLCDWLNTKFRLSFTPDQFNNLDEHAATRLILEKVNAIYRDKDSEFPVQVAMSMFMNEKATGAAGQQRYNREGLFVWASTRFPKYVNDLNADNFRTESRSTLREMLLQISRKAYPMVGQAAIDEQLDSAMSGTSYAEAGDAQELADWMRKTFDIEMTASELTGKSRTEVRKVLWNRYDMAFRPEMHRMERGLVLDVLDNMWKNHLLTMDHLRAVVGLRGYAQEDPKTVYKKEGMEEFGNMWENLNDRVTDMVFRVEDAPEEAMHDALVGAVAYQAQATRVIPQATTPQQAPVDNTTTNSTEAPKHDPIRKSGQKVGRNDPCPCGSGKKYKNCHMNVTQPR